MVLCRPTRPFTEGSRAPGGRVLGLGALSEQDESPQWPTRLPSSGHILTVRQIPTENGKHESLTSEKSS